MAKTDPTCIFCKIVAGEIPSHRVYEDDHVLAFLDINPTSRGHTLIIPKEHYTALVSTPPDVLAKLTAVLPKISAAVTRATDAQGFNLLQSNGACAGQIIAHIHFHVIPRRGGDGIRLGFRQQAAVQDELGATAQAIRAAL